MRGSHAFSFPNVDLSGKQSENQVFTGALRNSTNRQSISRQGEMPIGKAAG